MPHATLDMQLTTSVVSGWKLPCVASTQGSGGWLQAPVLYTRALSPGGGGGGSGVATKDCTCLHGGRCRQKQLPR